MKACHTKEGLKYQTSLPYFPPCCVLLFHLSKGELLVELLGEGEILLLDLIVGLLADVLAPVLRGLVRVLHDEDVAVVDWGVEGGGELRLHAVPLPAILVPRPQAVQDLKKK